MFGHPGSGKAGVLSSGGGANPLNGKEMKQSIPGAPKVTSGHHTQAAEEEHRAQMQRGPT